MVLSLSLLLALVVGYAMCFKVVKIGPLSLGLYGVILLVDFLIQFSCAILNRRSVNRIAAQASGSVSDIADENALGQRGEPRADISIAVVGYREDEDAWCKCLRSLQHRTLRPRSIIAVVDGNESADMVMANAFVCEFRGHDIKVIHLPILLSEIYRETYYEALSASGGLPSGRMAILWHWLQNKNTPGEVGAHMVARDRIIHEVSGWESVYSRCSMFHPTPLS
jgi:hyaluronan synthase